MRTDPVDVQTITVNGKTLVILEKAEYDRLRALADLEPPLPAPDAEGNYPAEAAVQVTLARTILRRRRAVGWTQGELARQAGVRPETLKRIENAEQSPGPTTLGRIERALTAAEAEQKGVR
jgi:DNA-binding XRE family transcriptional regulator